MCNRSGRGFDGVVATLGKDGVARRIEHPVYVVTLGCPLHAPRTPGWVVPAAIMAGAACSWLTSVLLDLIFFSRPSLVPPLIGVVVGVVVMLLAAYAYDRRQRVRRGRYSHAP